MNDEPPKVFAAFLTQEKLKALEAYSRALHDIARLSWWGRLTKARKIANDVLTYVPPKKYEPNKGESHA